MKKLIIILAAAAMTGCGIYKPYTRPEVKTIPTCNRRNGGSRKPRRRLSRRAWLTCRRSTSHLRAA